MGKISIPDAILNKKGRLTAEEYELMKTHTDKGAELLSRIPQMREHAAYRYAYDIALHHHERWDGGGYPHHLVGNETPIWTQIVSLADGDATRAFEAAHTLKGVAGNLSMTRLFQQADRLTEDLRRQDLGAAKDSMPELEEQYAHIISALRELQ